MGPALRSSVNIVRSIRSSLFQIRAGVARPTALEECNGSLSEGSCDSSGERKRNKQRRQTVAARQKKGGGGGGKRETKMEDNRNSWNSCKRDRPGGEHGRATKKTRVATRRTHTSVSFTRSVLSLFTYARTIDARVKHTNGLVFIV